MSRVTLEFIASYVQSDVVIDYSQERLNELAAVCRAAQAVVDAARIWAATPIDVDTDEQTTLLVKLAELDKVEKGEQP